MPDFITQVVSRTDPVFSTKDTRNYGLNILFSETAFAFTMIDFRSNRYLMLQHLKKNEHSPRMIAGNKPSFSDFMKAALATYPWLKNPYRSIKIGYEGQKATLIPVPLFDAPSVRKYLELNFTIGAKETEHFDQLSRFDTFLVYSMPENLHQTMKDFFPQAKIVHHSSVFLYSIWFILRNRPGPVKTFVNIRDLAFELMIYDGRQLTFFNTFNFVTPEDVVYYVLYVMEHLGLNPEKIPVILLGNIDRSSNLHELLYRYVKHVEFGRRNDVFRYVPLLNQLPPHGYFTLFSFQACGL